MSLTYHFAVGAQVHTTHEIRLTLSDGIVRVPSASEGTVTAHIESVGRPLYSVRFVGVGYAVPIWEGELHESGRAERDAHRKGGDTGNE